MGEINGASKRAKRAARVAAVCVGWATFAGFGETAALKALGKNGEDGGFERSAFLTKDGGNEKNEENGENWKNGRKTVDAADFAAFEEAFFELLGRCDSPILSERDAAEDALFERFAEFEPIWQNRRFLTNGEISPEARRRFELAEARFRQKTFEDCVAAFEGAFERGGGTADVGRNGENSENRENASNDRLGENEKNGADNRNGEDDGETRGVVRLRWGEGTRIVYLIPDWGAFERRDDAGRLWRPSDRFSAPEIAPEFGATETALETRWELDDWEDGTAGKDGTVAEEDETAKDGEIEENKASAGNEKVATGGGKTTVVGLFEGLFGVDVRDWRLSLPAFARGNGENERGGKNKEDGNGEGKRVDWEKSTGPNRANVFQSGEVRAVVEPPRLNANGETTAIVRLEFAEAFDAFDSHRVWYDRNDFALCIDDESANDGDGSPSKGRWEAIRLRTRGRSVRGVAFELDFPSDPALRKAIERGTARLLCRVPRFFLRATIPVAGVETVRAPLD